MAISSASMNLVSVHQTLPTMTNATVGCDRNHKLTIDGMLNDDPEELSFVLKAFATEMPANAQLSGNGVPVKCALSLDAGTAIAVGDFHAVGIAPTQGIESAQLAILIECQMQV